jgi:predicted nucleotidyltransferase
VLMLDVIKQHQEQITALCKRFGVKRLELFGSAVRSDFNPTKSDLDFFVEFVNYDIPAIADDWFGLQEELQKLLGKQVDLVTLRTASNPYFLESANRNKVTLYAA